MRLLRHSTALCALILVTWFPLMTTGQPQVLRGIVRHNVTNKPLSGARILLPELKRGAVSEANGSFVLRIYHPNIIQTALHISLLGYAREERQIHLANDTVTLEIRLKESAVQLGAARITAKRIQSENMPTQDITTISEQELERSRGQTLGESLQNVAGITLLQTGASIAKPVIRGLHSQRIVVVNAGVQQEGQQWGAEHAPEIDPFAAQRIEVVRGAAGVEYGAGAIGGVIRVEPRHIPHGNWFGGEAHTTLFSNNSQGAISLALEGGDISHLPVVFGHSSSDNTSATMTNQPMANNQSTNAPMMNDLLKGFGWRVQGSARKAGDSRAAAYTIGNTGFQEVNGSVAFGYTGEKLSIEAYYSLFTTELGIFRGAHIGNLNDLLRAIEAGKPLVSYDWTYSIRPPKQQISHDLWSVKARYDTDFGQFEMQYGWQQNNRAEFDSHNARIRSDSGLLLASLERPAMTLQLTTYSLDTKFRHKPLEILQNDSSSIVLTGVIGASGMAQWNVQGGRTFIIPSFEAQSAGIYAIETLTTPDFTANLGLRYDAKNITVRGSSSRNIPDTMQVFTGFSAAAGLKIDISQWLIGQWSDRKRQTNTQMTNAPMTNDQAIFLALNLGVAWRAPLVNEQFSLGVHHGTAQYEIGNNRLQPERSYSIDLTLSHYSEIVRLELSGYMNAIENFIYLRPDAGNPTVTIRGTFPTFFYTQTFALLTGADASIDAVLVKSSQNGSLMRLGGTASLVRGMNITDGEPLIFMPADRLRVFARYEHSLLFGMTNVFLEAASMLVRRQDHFPKNVDYTVPPEGYVLFDISAGSSVEWLGTRFSWNLSVRNVLNTAFRDYLSRYRYFTDDAGRNVILRLSVPFGDGR